MGYIKILALAVVSILVITGTAYVQEPAPGAGAKVEFVRDLAQFPAGEYELVQTYDNENVADSNNEVVQKSTMTNSFAYGLNVSLEGEGATRCGRIEATMKRVLVKVVEGETFSYDSDGKPEDQFPIFEKQFKYVIGLTSKAEIAVGTGLMPFKGIDAGWEKGAAENSDLKGVLTMNKQNYGDARLDRMFAQGLEYLFGPTDATAAAARRSRTLKVGDMWNVEKKGRGIRGAEVAVAHECKLEAVRDGYATVSVAWKINDMRTEMQDGNMVTCGVDETGRVEYVFHVASGLLTTMKGVIDRGDQAAGPDGSGGIVQNTLRSHEAQSFSICQKEGPSTPSGPGPGSDFPHVAQNPPSRPTRILSQEMVGRGQWADGSLAISPDGRRLAFAVKDGDRTSLVVDGEVQSECNWARKITFSADSKHVACVTTREGHDVVVVDKKDHAPQVDLALNLPLVFSLDGKRIAYVARHENAPYFNVVVDGEYDETAPADSSRTIPVFSLDGKRLAYLGKNGAKCLVAADGKRGKEYDDIGRILFSADGAKLAYEAREGNRWLIVRNGEELRQYDDVVPGTLAFSPDGKRMAYAAGQGKEWFVVVDGREEPRFEYIGNVSGVNFSPDGKRIAYAVQSEKKWAVVVDGKRQELFDRVGKIVFSPDSSRIAYEAFTGDKASVVIDGKEERGYEKIAENHLFFSPDSRRLAYLASDGKQWRVVIDGVEGKAYDVILADTPAFSPDGKHMVFFAMARDGSPFVVVDDREGKPNYPNIYNISGGRVVFDSSTTFHYFAGKDGKIFLVEEEIVVGR
ncbi:MAG: hypothetical protein RDV41_06145 [Planctomycetota bacterium]|nr:hypothetical protein [Planctomycetota bacterium]